jgi:acyl carrier protein phosphodiesterase
MNWLAHLHLSEDDVEVRLGNVIADFIKGEKRQALNARIRRGVASHMFIDSFTDAHPVFLRSRQRISQAHRKFAGIVVDVFYDHFLSVRWSEYSAQPKRDFIDGIYADFDRYTELALPDARRFVLRMAEDDWLGEYETLAGIERTLDRVSGRLKRPGLLVPLAAELSANYDGLAADFAEFYPALRAAVALWFDQVGKVDKV